MDALIQDLLSYSSLSRSEMKFEAVRWSVVIESVLALLAENIKAKDAVIQIAPDLPSVIGHQLTLEHILSNLIAHSLKFIRPDLRPEIRLWTERREGGVVRLWVEDNGMGSAPEHHEPVFGIFERLHNTESYPGSGIGLAIVRKGAERMRGKVGVESQVGSGSRFWIDRQPHRTPRFRERVELKLKQKGS